MPVLEYYRCSKRNLNASLCHYKVLDYEHHKYNTWGAWLQYRVIDYEHHKYNTWAVIDAS